MALFLQVAEEPCFMHVNRLVSTNNDQEIFSLLETVNSVNIKLKSTNLMRFNGFAKEA